MLYLETWFDGFEKESLIDEKMLFFEMLIKKLKEGSERGGKELFFNVVCKCLGVVGLRFK